jgi:hypothetical protein
MVRLYFILLIIFSLFQGCSTTSALHNLSGNTDNGAEPSRTEFIELNDGTIIEGEITKERLRQTNNLSLGKKGDVTISGKKYDFSEIRSLQNDNVFFRKTPYKTFAQRIVKGKINVYRTYHDATNSKGGSYTYQQHYIQKGDAGKMIWFEVKILEEMISDYQSAVDKMNEYKALRGKDMRFKGDSYLDSVINVYNSQQK